MPTKDSDIRLDQITSNIYKGDVALRKKEVRELVSWRVELELDRQTVGQLVRRSRRGTLHIKNRTLESVTEHFAVIRFAAIM